MKFNLFLSTLLLTSLGWLPTYSQAELRNNLSTSERPSTKAVMLQDKPVIDGEVLADVVWRGIPSFGNLIQTRPQAGATASEKTEIRIAYDQESFYVAVICHDSKPEKLVVTDARRDASLDNTDAFLMILDTYHDGQNGFVFGTNTLGVEYDAQVDNEGIGNFNSNRQQGGIIGGFNLNWDASWTVKAKTGDFGWSAEFAIPLRTIRYQSGEDQIWGLNFRRNIRKTNEIVYWSPIPINFDLNRLSLAGTLTGLNLRSPGNLKVIPYALGRAVRDYAADENKTNLSADAGLDLKYSVTPSLTLDLTYNTDFAQVEVDDQQVNLDRFNLFFPEKRPFFLENAGQFSVGSPGEVDLFFSRRIGIGEGGQVVPITGGARLSGKVNNTNLGFLSMFTPSVKDFEIEPNNFTVARINHEFAAKRSAIGGIFVNREGLGNLENDFNRTFALDGKLGLGQKARISGYVAKTNTPDISENDHSLKLQANYDWNGWSLMAGYTEVGEGFNPEVGFLLRSAFRKPEFRALYQWRMNGRLGLLELRPHVSYRSYWTFDGFQETKFLHIDNHWEWVNGLEIHTGLNLTTEGVLAPFEISPGIIVAPGTYEHSEAQLVFMTNESKNISISTRHVLGGFFGGERYANSATLKLRFGDRFNSEFIMNHNDIRLPEGDFIAKLFGTRLAYSFTPRIYLQSLIQFNSVSDLWSANIRFGWLQQANSGLFLVYNELRNSSDILSRSFTVKYSYLIDVLK
ncbi:MAG: carbohydrate binding family 9 domain-containing protein [Saprospiraceae bacterium]|nr:carbohydrate binding family 9 domain-containing protein [Saprospiraceae bacterium]